MPPQVSLSRGASGLSRCLHTYAHVRPSVVVKLNRLADSRLHLAYIGEMHAFEQLILHRVVDTLRLGVLLGITVLCHAYPNPVLLEKAYVGCACVLHSPVGMMD